MSDRTALAVRAPSGMSMAFAKVLRVRSFVGALAFAVLCAGSIGLKLVSAYRPPMKDPSLREKIVNFLGQQGYTLVPIKGGSSPIRVAAVAKSGCRVQIIEARTQGWDRNAIEQMAGPGDNFAVVFEGALYETHPGWRAKAYHYWDRFRHEIGIIVTPRPVLAVITSFECATQRTPWQDLVAGDS